MMSTGMRLASKLMIPTVKLYSKEIASTRIFATISHKIAYTTPPNDCLTEKFVICTEPSYLLLGTPYSL